MGNTDQSRLRCDQRAPDNIVDGKWHRLIGNSGTKIPDSCVPMRRCGTHAPGWLNGIHPQLQEGQVNRKVCYHWSSRCCNWQNNIKVRSCGDFYVYNLIKPPHCWLRYCGDNNTGQCKTLEHFYFICLSIFFFTSVLRYFKNTAASATISLSPMYTFFHQSILFFGKRNSCVQSSN